MQNILHSQYQCLRVAFAFCILFNTWYLSLSIYFYSSECVVLAHCGLIYNSLINWQNVFSCTYLLFESTYSFMKCLFTSLAYFFYSWIVAYPLFLFLNCRIVAYPLNASALSNICIPNVFSWSVVCSFIFLIGLLKNQAFQIMLMSFYLFFPLWLMFILS